VRPADTLVLGAQTAYFVGTAWTTIRRPTPWTLTTRAK
jgi:hypothetical protein